MHQAFMESEVAKDEGVLWVTTNLPTISERSIPGPFRAKNKEMAVDQSRSMCGPSGPVPQDARVTSVSNGQRPVYCTVFPFPVYS
jgi:hypothetical protein